MKKAFSLRFNVESAPFEGHRGRETARILRTLADLIEGESFDQVDYHGRVWDAHDNAVGEWRMA